MCFATCEPTRGSLLFMRWDFGHREMTQLTVDAGRGVHCVSRPVSLDDFLELDYGARAEPIRSPQAKVHLLIIPRAHVGGLCSLVSLNRSLLCAVGSVRDLQPEHLPLCTIRS